MEAQGRPHVFAANSVTLRLADDTVLEGQAGRKGSGLRKAIEVRGPRHVELIHQDRLWTGAKW